MATQFPGLIFSRRYAELTSRRSYQPSDRLFDAAYEGMITMSLPMPAVIDDDPVALDVSRWTRAADAVDMLVVARCEPPVIDLGCGPGRMVQALAESGRAALGVDISSVAVGMSMARGGPALRRRIDEPLPAEGRWGTALLMDTNVGLGGNVVALLARCMRLVTPGGLIICEVDRVPERHDVHTVVLRTRGCNLTADGVVTHRDLRAAAGGRIARSSSGGGVDERWTRVCRTALDGRGTAVLLGSLNPEKLTPAAASSHNSRVTGEVPVRLE